MKADYTSSNLISSDRRSRNKNSHSCGIITFFRRHFVSVVNISSLSSLLADFFFLFKAYKVSLKQASGLNHKNTINQSGKCLF